MPVSVQTGSPVPHTVVAVWHRFIEPLGVQLDPCEHGEHVPVGVQTCPVPHVVPAGTVVAGLIAVHVGAPPLQTSMPLLQVPGG